MASKPFDLDGLQPLDVSGLLPQSGLDVNGLEPLDATGLQPIDKEFSLDNTARLTGERAGDVAGNFIDFGHTLGKEVDSEEAGLPALILGRSRETLEKAGVEPAFYLGDHGFGVASYDEKQRIRQVSDHFLKKSADALKNLDLGGDETKQRSWDEVKDSPISNVLPFIVEQGLVSTPDMLAAIYATPAYVTSRSQEIGGERAINDGRAEPTVEDVVKAAPAAVASAILERFGGKGMLGIDEAAVQSAKQILPEVGKAALKEGATEFGQSIIENAGATVGTERGFEMEGALDEGFAGAVAGTGFGGIVRGGTATGELVLGSRPAPAGETDVDGQRLATVPDNVSDADIASPIPTDVISEGRAELDAALNHAEAPAADPVPQAPTVTAQPELETLFDMDSGEAIGQYNPGTGETFLGTPQPEQSAAQTPAPVPDPAPAKRPKVTVGNDIEFDGRPMNITAVEGRFIIATNAEGVPTVFRGKKDFEARTGHTFEGFTAARGAIPKRPPSLVELLRKQGIRKDDAKAQGVDLDGKLPKHLAQVFSNNPKTLTLDQVGERLSEMGLLPQGAYDLSDVVELVNQDLLAHRNKDMSQAVVPAADVVEKVARQEYEARQFELGELADLSYTERAKQLRQQYEAAPAVGNELTQAEIEAAFDLDNYRASYFDENDAAERAAMEAYYRGQDNDGAGRPGHGEQADTRNRGVSGNPAGPQDGRRGSEEAGRNASLEGPPTGQATSAAELDPFDLSQPVPRAGNLSKVGQKELSKIQANAVIEAGLAVEGSPLQAIAKKARAGKLLSKSERSTREEAFARNDQRAAELKLTETEQRAASVYQKLLQQGYNGNLPLDDYRRQQWREQVAELAENPGRYHPVVEAANDKGLSIGDEVVVGGDPAFVVSIDEQAGNILVKVASTKNFGGWLELEKVTRPDEPLPQDADGQARVPGSERTDEKEQAASRAEAEMRARQQQSKIRKDGQESLADQDGGLFSAERDQGNLFDTSGLQELKSGESKKEDADVSGSRANLERDSRDTGSENGLGETDVSATRRGSEQGPADGRTAPDSRSRDGDAGRTVSDADAAPLGERGDRGARRQQSLFDDGTTERDERGRGDTDGGSRQAENDAGGKDTLAPNADEAAQLEARTERQAAADKIKVKPADAANIRDTLPLLLKDQQTDVLKAETRFNNPDALPGYLFTNGTGTGKTYVGAGVVKRYARQGKDNILIVAPSQGILQGWVEAGTDLGLNISILDDTKSKGKGIVATTYANLGENPRLAERDWDLVVNDESQELSKNERGDPTLALNNMRAITNRGRSGDRYQKARMLLADKWAPYFELVERARTLKNSKKKADKDLAENLMFKAKELGETLHPETKAKADSLTDAPRTDVLFLSATPFAYDKNIDYAEGYLFDYGRDKEGGRAYNEGDARDQFFMQHFGYRMRYNKLTRPESGVDSEVMEREFHEWLKKEGALSGRRLEVDADYDRKFVLVDDAVGAKIDQALDFLREADKGKFRDLADLVNKRFDYLTRMKLLEAIKARHAVPMIKQHLALGHKVVVFHDYNVGGGINPFVMPADEQVLVRVGVDGTEKEISLQKLYAEFIARNPYVEKLNFSSFRSPINEIRENFDQALIYNGRESAKARNEAKKLFNDDESGHDVILVQSAAGEAGISLHDAKNGKQRALINLGMPTRPTTAIQEEGRIYRTGQTSDAIFRYMNTGTSWERWTFAQKIAERAGTAENLALGNEARALKQSFIDAFIDSDVYEPTAGEGKGGKELDFVARDELSGFERAKTFYWAQQKKSGRRDQREGQDYYATPEPIGFKMVELADIKRGERILEPSAGHGAIARFFPEDTDRTIVEPSSELASKAAIVSAGANAKNHTFEELNVRLKYDAVVMNPPYGMGGKVAMDHLAKAMKHTKNGGRVVALIPTGPAADKRFDALYESKEAKAFHLVADIKLPSATFTRAGTSVMTRIVVLEKQSDSSVAETLNSIRRDYTSAATVEELFERIEDLDLTGRKDPVTADADEIVPGEPFQIGEHTYSMRLTSHDLDGSNYVEWAKYPGRTEHARLAAMAERMNGNYFKALKAFSFDTVEDSQAWITEARKPVSEGTVSSKGIEGVTFDTGETTHSKTGQDLYVASFQTRHDMDVFVAVREIAKKHDGYYSKFRGRGAIPGFQFKTEEQRQAFIDEVTQGTATEEKFKLQDEATEDAPQRELSGLSQEAKKQLEERFHQLGLDAHAGLFFVKEISTAVEGQKLSANGRFIKLKKDGAVYRFIEIAEDAPDAQHTLDHETIHVLRSIGAFRKSEWTALTKAAKKDRQLMARIDRLYGNQGLSEDAVMEEAAAEMFADWSRNRSKYTGFIRKAFERVRAVLDAIREAITGTISAQTVMERVEKGKTAKRQAQANITSSETKLQQRASESLLNTDFGQPIRSMVEEMHRTHLPLWGRIRNATSRLAVREQFDRLRHVMQDAMLPVFRLQGEIERATGKPVGEALDVYQKETLYSGRVGARFEQLVDNHLEPLMEDLKAKGVTMEELEAYLYARHAKERNAYIAEINPEFEDGAGSGMTDAEADELMKAVKAAGKDRAMKDLAGRVDKVLGESLQARVDDGLLSEEEALALKKRWKHYVPLRGEAEIDPDQSLHVERPRSSAGQSVKGREYQQAFGRKTKAAEIIPYIFMQAQEGIIRGEKNRVAKTLHNLAVNNPNSDFWTVKKITRKPYLDKKTGQVVYRVQPIAAEDADFTVSAKQGGKVVRVIMNRHNPAAVRLAAAMRNLDGEKMGHLVQWLSTATRFLSAINTSFNPEFVVSNALRDLETGLALSGQFDVKGLSKKILKSWIPAIVGAEQGAFKRGDSEWKRWFDEYTAAGGRVYFNTMDDVKDTRKKLQRMFKEAGPGMHPLKPLRALGDTIQKVNLGVESAIRLSLYRHLRENGFSKDRAAVAAKELTVNFNRKGTMGPTLNAFYMFYNAGIQGTFTLLTAAKRSRKVRQALGGLVVAGAFLEVWNQLFSPEDDDGEKAYDKLSEFEKSRNFIFYIPGSDRPIEFPAGYGLNFFLHAGRASVEAASGKDPLEVLANLSVTGLEAFNPIGGAGSVIKQLSPTVIDPLVELELNEDFAGRQIYPNSPFDDFTPDSQKSFASVSPFAEAMAEGLNELTGGSKIEPGAIDVSPESIEHLFTFVTGSSGRFYQRLADLPMKLVDPTKDVTENDIPFLRKLVGPSDFTWKNRERFYERTEAIERAWAYFNDYRKAGDTESATEFLEENRDLLALRDLSRKVKRDLSKLRRVRLALQESKETGSVSIDDYAARLQPVRDAEKNLINSFNKAYVERILNKDGD